MKAVNLKSKNELLNTLPQLEAHFSQCTSATSTKAVSAPVPFPAVGGVEKDQFMQTPPRLGSGLSHFAMTSTLLTLIGELGSPDKPTWGLVWRG